MSNSEIALQLTLSAMEKGYISFLRAAHPDANTEAHENVNKQNVQQVLSYYETIYNKIIEL